MRPPQDRWRPYTISVHAPLYHWSGTRQHVSQMLTWLKPNWYDVILLDSN